MVENGIAEPRFSDWSSPCLLVGKPNGAYRFCTDYRKFNAVTTPDCFPLQRLDDCVDRVLLNMSVSLICLKATGKSLLLTEQNLYLRL